MVAIAPVPWMAEKGFHCQLEENLEEGRSREAAASHAAGLDELQDLDLFFRTAVAEAVAAPFPGQGLEQAQTLLHPRRERRKEPVLKRGSDEFHSPCLLGAGSVVRRNKPGHDRPKDVLLILIDHTVTPFRSAARRADF